MSFYSSISKAYDTIFPFNPVQLEFVESCFGGSVAGKRIVDAGCGTGSLAIMLARRSARVVGFDSDKEMIAIAEKKRPQALDMKFRTGDLKEELTRFEKNRFDAVLCLGNTLVHLKDEEEVDEFVHNASEVLKPGGKLLLQIVNYNRVLDKGVKSLPLIETSDHKFERNYVLSDDGHISFETTLTNMNSGVVTRNSVPLVPLRKETLEKIVQKYFSETACFGDFKQNDWSVETFHLVIKAEK
jgi:SAM-dependent methyltransferase